MRLLIISSVTEFLNKEVKSAMTIKEMKELARRKFMEQHAGKPVEDLTKVANEGSTHDPKTLPKPEKDEE